MTWRGSTQPRWAVATPKRIEVEDRVGVGIDGENYAVVAGSAGQGVVEVEPVGEGVDLQGGTGAGRGGEHRVHVEVDRGSPAEAAGRGVADDVDAGVLHGGDEATGHGLGRLVEVRVHRGDQQVEAGQELVIPVQRPVRSDVELRAVQHLDAAPAG
jgi:hypothetical protein